MAIIDVVKCDMTDGDFVSKFPSDDLRLGTQLVVYPSQTAFFLNGGKICDEFSAGTYTIKTENIPILNKLINIPFGSKSPFKAEVWFVNQISKLDMKWGTPQPIQLEDPKYGIIVPVRSFGQYGIRINNPRNFLEFLNGNMARFDADKINEYFKGKIIQQLSSLISQQLINENVSILDINAHLLPMSEYCQNQLSTSFEKYGIDLVDFSIVSINVPTEDPSMQKLKEAKEKAAMLKVNGRDFYQMERSFDVLEHSASNEGSGGQVLSMAAGLGAGLSVGNTMGQMASQMINTNPTPPPIPQQRTYFLYVNGRQLPNQNVQNVLSLISQGVVDANTLVWYQGLPSWISLCQIPELAQLLQQTPPPVLPTM